MTCLRPKQSFSTLNRTPCSRECNSQIEQATNALHLSNIVTTIQCDLLAARPRVDLITPYHIVMLYHGDTVVSDARYGKNLRSSIVQRMREYIADAVSPISAKGRVGPMLPLQAESWYLSRLLATEKAWSPLDWEDAASSQRLLLTRNLERFVNHLEEYMSIADLLIARLEKCWPMLEEGAIVRKRFKEWQENGFRALYRPSAHWLRSPWFGTRDSAIRDLLDLYQLTGRQLSKQRVPYISDNEKSIYRLLSTRK